MIQEIGYRIKENMIQERGYSIQDTGYRMLDKG